RARRRRRGGPPRAGAPEGTASRTCSLSTPAASRRLPGVAHPRKLASEVVAHHVVERGEQVTAQSAERGIPPAVHELPGILREVVELAALGVVLVACEAPAARRERAEGEHTADHVVLGEYPLARTVEERSALRARGHRDAGCAEHGRQEVDRPRR